ncbi:hypothetical protein [Clostridium thermobutyricum]|uniref:hypothetical protein n=1 Tax=Clostridium thermobutyricum TaxID=29372 RepID=UPI003F51E50C
MKIKSILIPILVGIIILLLIIISLVIYNNNSIQKPLTKNVTLSTNKNTSSPTSSTLNNVANSSNQLSNIDNSNISNNNANSQSNTQNYNTNNNSTNMAQSTGNFSDIIDGNTYLTGNIEGDTIIIPLNNATIVNKQLILNEYYVDRLNEKFTLKVSSLGNNNFVMYEFFNGVNTGIFTLKSINSQYSSTLSGTFSKPGSNKVIGIQLSSNQSASKYPFFKGYINGTQVIFAPYPNHYGFLEKYEGDNNIFSLSYMAAGPNSNFQFPLTESFDGKTTGEYELNYIDNYTGLSGFYIKAPVTKNSIKYPITLTGSYTP